MENRENPGCGGNNSAASVPALRSKDEEKPSAFIVMTGEPGHNESTRRLVKSHVMRNSHRERRLQRYAEKNKNRALQNTIGPPQPTSTERKRGSGKAKLIKAISSTEEDLLQLWNQNTRADIHTLSHAQRTSSTIPKQIPGHDPFRTLPIASNDRTYMILQNSRAHTYRTSIYSGTKDYVLQLASSSPSFTWTVLCVEAYVQSVPYRSFLPESAAYLQNAIICINSDLSRDVNYYDDATLAAITHFSNFEVMYGNPTGAAAHLEGLSTMVNLRGGLESLEDSGILRRWVIWSDLIASTRFEIPPKFPRALLPPITQIPISAFLPPHLPIPPLTPPPYLITPMQESGRIDLLTLTNSTHELAFFLDATASLPGSRGDQILLEAGYHDRVSAIEYDLNILLGHHPADSSTKDTSNVSRVFLLTSLLHVYSCLRLTRSAVGIRSSLADRLQVALLALTDPPARMWNEMLWICVVGLTTCSLRCKGWYGMMVRDLCRSMGLVCWDDVGVVLRKGVWIERGRWRECEVAWNEIQGRDEG